MILGRHLSPQEPSPNMQDTNFSLFEMELWRRSMVIDRNEYTYAHCDTLQPCRTKIRMRLKKSTFLKLLAKDTCSASKLDNEMDSCVARNHVTDPPRYITAQPKTDCQWPWRRAEKWISEILQLVQWVSAKADTEVPTYLKVLEDIRRFPVFKRRVVGLTYDLSNGIWDVCTRSLHHVE